MSVDKLTVADYPLAEKRPECVKGQRGQTLDDLTLDALLGDQVTMEDLRITAAALNQQAEIARSAGRATLAENFERAAELTTVPQDAIMRVYELLRPGRARYKQDLLDAASELRSGYGAEHMATFVEEAASVYEQRGLFNRRF